MEFILSVVYTHLFFLHQLDLVCDKDILGGTVQSVAHIGTLFGCLILSQLSDTYGRRKVLLGSLLGLGACGTAASFVWNYHLMAVLFFAVGFWTGVGATQGGVGMLLSSVKAYSASLISAQ